MAARLKAGYEQEGLTIEELVAREKISYGAVRRLLREAGARMRPAGDHSLSVPEPGSVGRRELAARLRTDYENEGLSIPELSAREQIPQTTVHGLLREAGARMRPAPHLSSSVPGSGSVGRRELAARLRAGYENEGLSLRELAARERFSRETVRMLLREAGTQLRPGGGASSGRGPSVGSDVQGPWGSAGESSSSAGGGPTRWEKGKWRAGQVPSAVERARQIAREMNLHYVGVGAGEAGAAREAHERNLGRIADLLEREGEEAARR